MPTGVKKIPACTITGAKATASRKRPPMAVTSSVNPHIRTTSQTIRTGIASASISEVAADRRRGDAGDEHDRRAAEAPRSASR